MLLALVALKSHSKATKAPSGFKRPNMARYAGMSDRVRKAVDADLDWATIVENLLSEPEKRREGRANNDQFLKTSKSAPKRKKHPTTLEATTVDELKKILVNLKLPTSGSKRELIARIIANRPIPPSIVSTSATTPLQRVNRPESKVSKKKPANPGKSDVRGSNKNKRMRNELDELVSDTTRFLSKKPKRH